MPRSALILLFILLSRPSILLARTWRIYEDGLGDAPTIQAGIDSAGEATVVLAEATVIDGSPR